MLIGQWHTQVLDWKGSQSKVHNLGNPKAIPQTPSGDIYPSLFLKIYSETGYGFKTHEQELQVHQTNRIILDENKCIVKIL